MDDDSLIDALNEITARFFERRPNSLLGSALPPFDTSKPNFHDSKTEFKEEQQAVELAIKQASGLMELVLATNKDDEDLSKMPTRVCGFLDRQARNRATNQPPGSTFALVSKSAVDIGLSVSLLYVLSEFLQGLYVRKQELDDQERDFWSGKSRPANHYARTIALRLARLIFIETGQKPTIGTSRDGSHPSTDYGRALEDVFKLLDIDANFRRTGKWAINQLTDEDLKPPVNTLAGWMNLGFGDQPKPRNALADITRALTKDQHK